MRTLTPAAILLALLLAGCRGGAPQPTATPTPKPTMRPMPVASPTMGAVTVRALRNKTTQVSIVVVAHGRTLYRVLADSNDSRRAPNGTYSSHFTNPAIVFFDQDGGRMRAKARTADADGNSKVVTLHGDVRVLTEDGSVLTCDQFVYDQAHNHVHGSGNVKVTTKQGDVLHGQTFDGDTKLQSVHVSG